MTKKIIIFIFILIIISCIGLYNLFHQNTIKNHVQSPPAISVTETPFISITPTDIPITPNPTYSEELKIQTKNEIDMNRALDEYSKNTPLLYLMPVETEDFNIEYLGNSKYKITLKTADQESAKQKALDWWKKKKIDLSLLDITWESRVLE